ncbi:hypothetical protein SPRG_09735 [Saprolegnia parasitica CBS 223.65]|uniref:F-box domain-containing protein n=1 Tax=Saprolegnia parasitica (strain CBS 223.65) TaxID=695850 RepID=A0A067C764_SAPPC|nr:hypothetical protein SPRG_09735 [Saprolegnia parasitica CBS 223.65]KDO25005.1 hypothetical protein SPRG_09735 [Saprolegnia parasitica CBS 223.65]|eukprot:XP_012204274.1 hypothetical protein SPRG_09735 [Saprolegnia parasitica CBS 223.65]
MHGADVAALLNALPASTLPVELIALRDLGAVVDLEEHWPVVHITKIPIQYARLGIAALPVFAGVNIGAGFTTLAWLDATPKKAVTLVVDPSVPGTLTTFAYNWGDRITAVIIKGHQVNPDPIPDILSRCVNVQSVTISGTIQNTITPVAAATYLSVLRTTQLVTLKVTVAARDALDVTVVVAWLQGPSAASLLLSCASVSDPTALASAIQNCSTLSSLTLNNAFDVQAALVSSPDTLHHVTALSLRQSAAQDDVPIDVLLGKLDRTKVLSLSVQSNRYQARLLGDVIGVLGMCPSLKSFYLDNWTLPAASMTGACPCLTSITLRRLHFDVVGDVAKIIQLLSTSHCLLSVDFCGTKLGSESVFALARALPVWMARGLQTLHLDNTGLGDADAGVLRLRLRRRATAATSRST